MGQCSFCNKASIKGNYRVHMTVYKISGTTDECIHTCNDTCVREASKKGYRKQISKREVSERKKKRIKYIEGPRGPTVSTNSTTDRPT